MTYIHSSDVNLKDLIADHITTNCNWDLKSLLMHKNEHAHLLKSYMIFNQHKQIPDYEFFPITQWLFSKLRKKGETVAKYNGSYYWALTDSQAKTFKERSVLKEIACDTNKYNNND